MYSDINLLPTERLKHIFNTPDSKSAIRVMCRQVLSSLDIYASPTPLKPICQKYNLKVKYNDVVKEEDSFLKISSEGFEIEISRRKYWRKNRFTIAHELSHLLIFSVINRPIDSFDRKQHDEIEMLCDVGASELLISERELIKNLKEHGLNRETLEILYDKFMVSYEAIFLRLAEYFGANILIWKKYARSDKEKIEYRVFKHFPKYKYAIKSIWLPNGCTTKHISPSPFENSSSVSLIEDFNVLINDKINSCHSLTFPFPHSRSSNINLPIFEKLKVIDESMYDDCHVMFIFDSKERFNELKRNFIRDEN